ncbi:MAG: NAD(P)-dependent alcohol dehydrogenase [Chloroflexota bacterium]
MSNTMKGVVLQGTVPQLRHDLPVPPVAKGEVRVKVLYSTVNGHEIELAANRPMRLLNKLLGARGEVQTGLEFSGVVETDGEVFSKGEKVLGYVDLTKGWKPHAEYLSIPEAYLARLPDRLCPAEAAALPMSALTALVALRDIGKVRAGDSILILGASGGVGVMAVQIAKMLGAKTTAVASSAHHELLKTLGADALIDYRSDDIAQIDQRYALIFDLTTMYRYAQVRHLLTTDGVFVPANPFNSLIDMIVHRKAVRWLLVDKGDSAQIGELADWAATGQLKAVIDQKFELPHYQEAFERALARGKAGRVLIEIQEA